MRNNKMPRRARILISLGLLLATLPFLFKEYIPLPDFAQGSLAGLGLGLEITGFMMARKAKKAGGDDSCGYKSSAESVE